MVGNARSHPHTPIFHGNGVPQNAPNFLPILAPRRATRVIRSSFITVIRFSSVTLSSFICALYALFLWPHVFFYIYAIRFIHVIIDGLFFYFLYICVVYHIIDTGVKFSVQLLHSKKCYRYKKRTPAGVLIIYSIVLLWLTPTGTHLLTFLSKGKLVSIILIFESYHSTIINHLNLIDGIFCFPVVREKPIIELTY